MGADWCQHPGLLRRERGLADHAIREWRLGFQQRNELQPFDVWGLLADDAQGVWLPRGVVIPWLQDGVPWGIKVRRPVASTDPHKYHAVKGSQLAILYGNNTITSHRPAILLESELDVALLAQEAGDVTGAASAGGKRTTFTGGQLDVLRTAHPIWVAYDADKYGRDAMEALCARGPRFRRTTWPAGANDLAAARRAGHDVRTWALAHLAGSAGCQT